MQREDFEYFLGRNVKLHKQDDFVLFGEILRVSDDCIVFKTNQKTSILRFENIKDVVEW